MKERDLSKI